MSVVRRGLLLGTVRACKGAVWMTGGLRTTLLRKRASQISTAEKLITMGLRCVGVIVSVIGVRTR